MGADNARDVCCLDILLVYNYVLNNNFVSNSSASFGFNFDTLVQKSGKFLFRRQSRAFKSFLNSSGRP